VAWPHRTATIKKEKTEKDARKLRYSSRKRRTNRVTHLFVGGSTNVCRALKLLPWNRAANSEESESRGVGEHPYQHEDLVERIWLVRYNTPQCN